MKKILVIYGPTATGKTDLAIMLAKKYNGEIISADSRQVYKGLDIGTGKVSQESNVIKHQGYWVVDGVKINGFDLVNPQQEFSVADFIKFASKAIDQIIKSNHLPIVVGGTGFYVKSLISGIDTLGTPRNQKLRRSLERLSPSNLFKKLEKLDFKKAQLMNLSDRANPRRLIRAIEIALTPEFSARHSGVATTTIESRSYRSVSLRSRMTNYLMVGLTAPNDFLYSRSDNWLDMRLKHGLVKEVQTLMKKHINKEWLENLGLEYRWISRYLKGTTDLNQAVLRLKGDIHSYIRRQKTYFRQFTGLNIQIFDISNNTWQNKLEKKVKSWYTEERMRN